MRYFYFFTLLLLQLSSGGFVSAQNITLVKTPLSELFKPKKHNEAREALVGIVKKGESIIDFHKRLGVLPAEFPTDNLNMDEDRSLTLFFMFNNIGAFEYFQDTKNKRVSEGDSSIVLHEGEAFFFKKSIDLSLPRTFTYFELGDMVNYKRFPLPQGWEWDEKASFSDYNYTEQRLKYYYVLCPQYDDIGIAQYSYVSAGVRKTYYRVVMHRRI